MAPFQLYRCKTDGKLVLPEDFGRHGGHKVIIASDGTLTDLIKVRFWNFTGRLKNRDFYQQ